MNNFTTLRNKARNFGTRFAGVSALALVSAPAAFAQSTGLADAVTSNVDTAELIAIGVVVLGISGIVMMVKRGQRVAS